MLKGIFVGLFVIHGLIHGLGLVKAWGWAELPQLTEPITRMTGILWFLAGLLVLVAAFGLAISAPWFWWLGAIAALASEAVIFSSFVDAKMGTLPNVLLLVFSLSQFMMVGPFSFRARYLEDAAKGRARIAELGKAAVVEESDLAHLPAPVAKYLRVAGFVGRPQVQSYELFFGMRLRGSAKEPWINGTVEQVSFADEPTRLFLLSATMYGLPVQAFHRYVDGKATFQVKIAGLIPMVDVSGPDLSKTETVTLFNDMFMLAPATLISPNILWESIDDRHARATFQNGPHTISAELIFDAEGMARDFISDDRKRSVQNGKAFVAQRFTTPVTAVDNFGSYRLPSRGEAHYHAPPPEGDLLYGEYELRRVVYNERLAP